ncbi:hypothetical protein [Neobacillus vireti]|uniref:Uncharacterized protein n=1 Tax=Neobacillus vireti LMG 21834 TaxID=1131730 RepID=A0AB94IJ64_9BACI|nr:hypothetical protein [Neobacillus vireti]ETI67065.1 hypothetical protein BAVI_19159 [Neobacillus vireti LMG 21834]KLT19682.1 hypothetical protein AA980_03610 [Neobacillus vireti]
MSLQMVHSITMIVTDKKPCLLCSKDFEYAAIVSGEEIEALRSIHDGKVVTDQVVILKKSFANHNKLQIVDVEITAKCPYCHSNNRFNRFVTLENSKNES